MGYTEHMGSLSTLRIVAKNFKPIVKQNSVTLVNIIFFVVVLFLLIFYEVQEAIFLSVVLFLNIIVGIIQDFRAKITLERLQILMAPKIVRVNKGGLEEVIELEEVSLKDTLKLSLGDQIPTDGVLSESHGLEVNESLLNGESKSIIKSAGDSVLAGSIVVAGYALLNPSSLPQESFVSQMTDKIKLFSLNQSPIQKNLSLFIKSMSYILLPIALFVIVHGFLSKQLLSSIVKDIAALTSTLVPQGLILATTVFFAYGAVKLFKKQVLLQEINATEKLGRIKNLCVDKTGTLTENTPVFEKVIPYGDSEELMIKDFTLGYMKATGDVSETMRAIETYVSEYEWSGKVVSFVPFSSSRKYGTATFEIEGENTTTVVGAPDILLDQLATEHERKWLESAIAEYAPQAKRLVLLAKEEVQERGVLSNEILPGEWLHPLALFILSNPLRPGTKDIINFFQNRGVRIRVISGDNPKTVQAIAKEAGVKHTDLIITGPEMEHWDDEEYEERVPAYHLYARIKPDQKEKIITFLKRSGFTAMVGDGANDCLAIKKSDLGIAMFNGAGATRQIAQIVLMNNSFSALPEGVILSDVIITNIELVASVFFNKVASGLFLFLILAFGGFTYPLSPKNTTIIGFFTIWVSIFYWTMFPAKKTSARNDKAFLLRVLPFPLLMGTITALAAGLVFFTGPASLQHTGSNVLVVITLTVLGFWYFVLTPIAFGVEVKENQKKVLRFFGALLFSFLISSFFSPNLADFFDLHTPPIGSLLFTIAVVIFTGWIQYRLTLRFFIPKDTDPFEKK